MERLVKWVKDGSVDTVIVAGVDLQGRLYGKRCAAVPFLRDMTGGVHTCDCNFGWDVERILIPNLAFTGWSTGYGDMTAVPDWNTLRIYPWFEKTALVLCDTQDHSGTLVPIAPRTILRKQLDHAATLGFSVKAASELEFFLFRETPESSREKNYTNLNTISRYIGDYCVYRSSMDDFIIGDLRKNFSAAGIEIECSKAEWGLGQHEVNLVYSDALNMADNHVIFKNGVREMAALRGLQATFMAKWDTDQSSNGCHVHMSLWNGSKSSFYDPSATRGMSKTMRHFLGGMMALARDTQLFFAPTINSYKRYGDLTFAPTTVTWGGDNRTVAFRSCGAGASTRLENRIAGADANVYLTYAAMLASGLYGIENEIEPLEPFVTANAYDLKDVPKLHRSLRDATDAFESSKTMRALFGDDVVDHYSAISRWEISEFSRSVTDWERKRYFELI
jgi:glutamine synthetase